MLQIKVNVTDRIYFKKPFVDWLSIVETHCLLVMQQIVLSTAHDIYRPFTICSDLLLHLTSFPKLYSYQKKN